MKKMKTFTMFFKHLRPQREINNKNRVAGCSNQSRLIPHMPACCPLSIHFSCTLLDATATELFVDQARLADTLLSTSAIMKPPPFAMYLNHWGTLECLTSLLHGHCRAFDGWIEMEELRRQRWTHIQETRRCSQFYWCFPGCCPT